MKVTTMDNQARDQQLQTIATDHLFIATLETRNSDRLDFHDVSVWAVKAALQAVTLPPKNVSLAERLNFGQGERKCQRESGC